MFDESAAVPTAEEYADFTDEAQPLGPYSCTADEAGGWTKGAASATTCARWLTPAFTYTVVLAVVCRRALFDIVTATPS
jgi:hypothetical protein